MANWEPPIKTSINVIDVVVFSPRQIIIDGINAGNFIDAMANMPQFAAKFQVALEKAWDNLLTQQIEGVTTPIKIAPDYKRFFNSLLELPIFQLAQQASATNLATNAAYTDFALLLGNAISGLENPQGLQRSLLRVLASIEGVTPELLAPLQATIEQYNIPIVLAETGEGAAQK